MSKGDSFYFTKTVDDNVQSPIQNLFKMLPIKICGENLKFKLRNFLYGFHCYNTIHKSFTNRIVSGSGGLQKNLLTKRSLTSPEKVDCKMTVEFN